MFVLCHVLAILSHFDLGSLIIRCLLFIRHGFPSVGNCTGDGLEEGFRVLFSFRDNEILLGFPLGVTIQKFLPFLLKVKVVRTQRSLGFAIVVASLLGLDRF